MIDKTKLDNTLFDQLHRDLPDYYDTMYKRGFTPQEVYIAFHRTWMREIRQRQEKQKDTPPTPTPDTDNYTVRGEVYLNGKRL